jgi:hypothetical protein
MSLRVRRNAAELQKVALQDSVQQLEVLYRAVLAFAPSILSSTERKRVAAADMPIVRCTSYLHLGTSTPLSPTPHTTHMHASSLKHDVHAVFALSSGSA